MENLNTLSFKDLIATYNAMAQAHGFPTVKKFSDKKTAISRIEKLYAEVIDKELEAETAPAVEAETAPAVEAKKAEKKAEKKARKPVIKFNADDTIVVTPEARNCPISGYVKEGKKVNVSSVELFYLHNIDEETGMRFEDLVKLTMDQFVTSKGIIPDEKWAIRNIRLFIELGTLAKI